MRIHCSWVLAAFGWLGCSSDSPPGARVAKDLTFPSSPVARTRSVSLIAAGDGFTMVGYEDGQVRWARVSTEGVLTHEAAFAMAAPTLGPYFAVTKKTVAADQLIAIGLYPSTTISTGYDLRAVVQDLDAPAPSSVVLLDTLPATTDSTKVRIAAGAAKSGNLGFVAWGIQVRGYPIKFWTLGADATHAAGDPPTAFGDRTSADQPPDWDCLAPTNGPSGLGFSILGPDHQDGSLTDWMTTEMDDTGAPAPGLLLGFPAQVSGCHILGKTTPSGGYDLAFEDDPGIGAAFFYPPADGGQSGQVMAYPIVIPSSNFSDPLQVPHVAWVAPAGNDITIGLARSSGPSVARFTFQAEPHGSWLTLRSASGKSGPVAAWTGSDYTYVTYSDEVIGSSGSPTIARYFMKIDASAQLP
jgi:hypothetical protein